ELARPADALESDPQSESSGVDVELRPGFGRPLLAGAVAIAGVAAFVVASGLIGGSSGEPAPPRPADRAAASASLPPSPAAEEEPAPAPPDLRAPIRPASTIADLPPPDAAPLAAAALDVADAGSGAESSDEDDAGTSAGGDPATRRASSSTPDRA